MLPFLHCLIWNSKGIPNWQDLYKGIAIKLNNYPWDGRYSETVPRVIYTKGELQIELWCLNSVMTENPNNNDSYYYSRASQKAKDFGRILAYSNDLIKLVIAFGTAGAPTEVSKNGGVVVGSYIFPYDAGKEDKDKRYETNFFGEPVASTITNDFFDVMNLGMAKAALRLYFETAVLSTPNAPVGIFPFIADKNIVAVGDINTKSYADFKVCDAAAVQAFNDLKKSQSLSQIPYSVDTTHSVIRLECKCDKFIFISAITDRYAYFDNEVTPRVLAQNFSASFNGGVFLNWFIPYCLTLISALAPSMSIEVFKLSMRRLPKVFLPFTSPAFSIS